MSAIKLEQHDDGRWAYMLDGKVFRLLGIKEEYFESHEKALEAAEYIGVIVQDNGYLKSLKL